MIKTINIILMLLTGFAYSQSNIPFIKDINSSESEWLQNNSQNEILLLQLGDYNNIQTNQSNSGITTNTIDGFQCGDFNDALIDQSGGGNHSVIIQSGNYNSSDLEVSGEFNDIKNYQFGDDNNIDQHFYGKSSNISFIQLGNRNEIMHYESSLIPKSFLVQQRGNNMKITIINSNIYNK